MLELERLFPTEIAADGSLAKLKKYVMRVVYMHVYVCYLYVCMFSIESAADGFTAKMNTNVVRVHSYMFNFS